MKTTIYAAILLLLGLVGQQARAQEPISDQGKQLFMSLLGRDYAKARQLILDGADVNYQIDNGLTPLMLAADIGNVDIARMLVEHHANVNAKQSGMQPNGFTALHFLVKSRTSDENFREIGDILFDAGANFNRKDADGNTPLHLAALRGSLDRVRYLVSKGANPAIQNNNGKVPLDLVPAGNEELQDYLLSVSYQPHFKKG